MAKPFIVSFIETSYPTIECNFYKTMGEAAYTAAIASAFTGQFYATGGAALIGGAAELAFNLSGCDDAPPPPPSADAEYCYETEGCALIVWYDPPDFNMSVGGLPSDAQRIDSTSFEPTPQYHPTYGTWTVNYTKCTGGTGTYVFPTIGPAGRNFGLTNSPCVAGKPAELPPHSPGAPIADPVFVPDPDTGCNWTIQATDAYVGDDGKWHTYYTVEADNDACGGPFAYWSSSDGPAFVPPTPPEEPAPPPEQYPAQGCCDELKELLEEIKQCACGSPKPELLGDWVSIRFVSDGISPGGTNPLRKLFRYRSQSARSEQQLRDYWAGFTWEAGPVIVKHVGAAWGQPQVWASTAEEAKRVIRFAAGEAGIDADTDGKWVVTGSSAPRYGMPGTMRIQQYRGLDWVTSRLGPSGPIEL